MQDMSVAKKKKRSKVSPPSSRILKKKIKKKNKKQIYDSDSSSLSEGEIADEMPKSKQINRKRSKTNYNMDDDESNESSDESDDVETKVQETSQSN